MASEVHRFADEIYNELRRVAHRAFRGERNGHTLQPTAVVHEAFLSLVSTETLAINDRQHFFRLAARSMRRILVGHARHHNRLKRGGEHRQVDLELVDLEVQPTTELDPSSNFEDLDRALHDLERSYERSSSVVELRYFAGLTVVETAEVLGVSSATVKREWQFAKAWLFDRMQPT